MASFKALMLARADGGASAAWMQLDDADLMDGDVMVRVTHSTINHKDGLALSGRLPGLRLPLIPGIDFSGAVTRPLTDVVALAPQILAGKIRGRVVLEVG